MTGLLPCPFCGSPAELEQVTEADDTYWLVQCAGRACDAIPIVHANSEEDAKARWNRRDPRANAQGLGLIEEGGRLARVRARQVQKVLRRAGVQDAAVTRTIMWLLIDGDRDDVEAE